MKILLKKCNYSRKKKRLLKNRILSFFKKEKLQGIAKQMIVDWTPQNRVNTVGGYYGGFISLYNNENIYINLTVFYELENLNNLNEVLWAIFHELIHCRQMYSGEIIISKDRNLLTYKGKEYDKLSFRGEKFIELYKNNRFEATEYHIKEIPWEGECYYKSDLYTGIRSFNHGVFDNVA
jgi:hypothetical protein